MPHPLFPTTLIICVGKVELLNLKLRYRRGGTQEQYNTTLQLVLMLHNTVNTECPLPELII